MQEPPPVHGLLIELEAFATAVAQLLDDETIDWHWRPRDDEWRQYQLQDGPVALKDFLAARCQTLVLLADVPEQTWGRRGQHAFFGPTSLHELLNLAVEHDKAHFDQLIALRHHLEKT
ncbi:MAG: hypothetical protein P8183_20835 [Anaerolineae bacterium]